MWVIIELIFYVSASLLPLALPLAMLLSSIMTVGGLAEHNELTALKSSGLSLLRILKPLIVVTLFISAFTFYFANYIIPIANYKWRALIYDIQDTKIATLITPGSYTSQIDGILLKVDKKNGNEFEDITIHDRTNPSIIKTVRAKRGTLYKATEGNDILLQLEDGNAFEESDLKQILNKGGNGGDFFPEKRYSFKNAIFKIQISGFNFKKTDDNLFKNDFEMYNVFQLHEVVDSIHKHTLKFKRDFGQKLNLSSLYFNDKTSVKQKGNLFSDTVGLRTFHQDAVLLNKLTDEQLVKAYRNANADISLKMENVEGQKNFLQTFNRNLNAYYIEFHRKFALTVAIIVLFFIGAPLGAIVKRGGFGAPVVIAALLFMVYFVLISVGESLASQDVTSPAMGMWLPTFIMIPFAILLTYTASNDLSIFSAYTYKRLFKRRRR